MSSNIDENNKKEEKKQRMKVKAIIRKVKRFLSHLKRVYLLPTPSACYLEYFYFIFLFSSSLFY